MLLQVSIIGTAFFVLFITKKLNWNSLPKRSLGLQSRVHMVSSFFGKVSQNRLVRRFNLFQIPTENSWYSKCQKMINHRYSKTLNFPFPLFPLRAQYAIHSNGLISCILKFSNYLTTYIEKENDYLIFSHYNWE